MGGNGNHRAYIMSALNTALPASIILMIVQNQVNGTMYRMVTIPKWKRKIFDTVFR